MMKTAEQVMQRFRKAQQLRQPRESRFDQAFTYAMPGRGSFFTSDADKTDEIDNVFDETAIVATQEFASRLQSGITPNFSRWAMLRAGSDIPAEDREEVDRELQSITEYCFEILSYSNFSTEIYEAYLDLSVTLGCLEIERGNATEPIRCHAVPISSLYVNVGPYDRIDQFFRWREWTYEQFTVKYVDHKFPEDKIDDFKKSKKPYRFIECIYRDWSKPQEEIYCRKLIWEGAPDQFVYEKIYSGVGSCPMIAFRWSKEAGSVWGRGPLMNALPAIKTCNLVVQMVLENAQMAISGMYNMDDDSTVAVDTIELVPGTIIPRTPGSRGLEPVGAAGNFDVSELVLQDMRMNIKKALYNDMLGNPERTPMSATEVAERMADLSRQIGAAFGRLMFEMVIPVLQRVIYLLKEQNMIQLPTVNGREIKVTATSPLAQAQNQSDIQAVDRLVEWVQMRFGPQFANVFIKGEAAAAYVGDKLQVSKTLMRNEQEMQAAIQQMMQMAQAGGEMGGPPQEGQAPAAEGPVA